MVPFDLPEAIVFDLDGTIADTETVEYQSISQVWAAHGATYTVAQFVHVIGTTEGPDWVDELSAEIGSHVNPAQAHAHRRSVQGELLLTLQARPGIRALFEQASMAGVPMAIASNSPLDWVEARLDHLALRHYLSVLITIDIASQPKPHPAPYLEACAALGAPPNRSIALEDSTTGVISARAAGLYTIACPGPLTQGHDLSAAHRIIGSHDDLTVADLGRAAQA